MKDSGIQSHCDYACVLIVPQDTWQLSMALLAAVDTALPLGHTDVNPAWSPLVVSLLL